MTDARVDVSWERRYDSVFGYLFEQKDSGNSSMSTTSQRDGRKIPITDWDNSDDRRLKEAICEVETESERGSSHYRLSREDGLGFSESFRSYVIGRGGQVRDD